MSDGARNKTVDEDFDEKRLADGDVPEDFLKVTDPKETTGTLVDLGDTNEKVSTKKVPSTALDSDHALALALQKELDLETTPNPAQRPTGVETAAPVAVSRPLAMQLTVTIVEAKLVRNYGLTRMDPYCRVRVGHSLYETPCSPNGSKEPKWNKTFNVILLPGIKSIDVEIYDECTFSTDSFIANGRIELLHKLEPRKVIDDWWPLSGQEGHEKEGVIHIIYSLNYIADPGVYAPQPPPIPKLTPEELEELKKMFPNVDKDVVLSVYVAVKGNKNDLVNTLLDM